MVFRARPNGSPLTPGPVSLGRGSNQACSGDDPRLTDARESIYVDGVLVGKRRNVNFVAGTNVTLAGTDVSDTDTVDVTINSTGGGGSGIRVDYESVNVATAVTKLNFIDAGNVQMTLASPASGEVNITVASYDTPPIEAIAGVTPAANKLAYFDSGTTAVTTDLTAFARTLLDDADAATARATLGIVGGGAQGVTTIDFGAFPGASDTSLAITGQTGIDSASVVTAWLQPADTDDHTADEHRVETLSVMAGNVVDGVGFTIYAQNTSQISEPLMRAGVGRFRSAATTVYGYPGHSVGGKGTRIYGKWTVAWKWS